MHFNTEPYRKIEKNQNSESYNYELDLSQLEEIKEKKKKNPQFQGNISVSCIDLLYRLLEIDPQKRLEAKEALKH